MTIREAFAKAGHPLPDDCRLLLEEMNRYGVCAWLCVHESGTTFQFRQLSNEWAWRSACKTWKPPFSIANLPAFDAYDALPKCVRDVLDAAEEEAV